MSRKKHVPLVNDVLKAAGVSRHVRRLIMRGAAPGVDIDSGWFLKSTTAAPSTQTITIGFNDPTGIILRSDGATVEGFQVDYIFCQGFSNFTNSRSVSGWSNDAAATSDCKRRQANTVLTLFNGSGTVSAECTAALGGNPNEVDLAWSTNDSSEVIIYYMAVGGDISQVAVGDFQVTTGSPGTTQDVNIGFTPVGDGRSLVLFQSICSSVGIPATGTDQANIMLGAATSATQRHVITSASNDNVSTSDTARIYGSVSCLAFLALKFGAWANDGQFDFTAWVTNGFRIDTLGAPSITYTVEYMVMDGANFAVHNYQAPLSDGLVEYTDAGFPAVGLILTTACINTLLGIPAHNRIGEGWASAVGTESAMWAGDTDNLADTSADRWQDDTDLLIIIDNDSITIDAAVQYNASLAGGWKGNWSATNAATYFGAIVIGDAPAVSGFAHVQAVIIS